MADGLRLAGALELLRRAAEKSGACLVALSGGKDSLVTLDVCCQAFSRVEAFFMWQVPNLRCIEAPAEAAARRYGVKLHKVPHFSLAELFKKGALADRCRGTHLRQLGQRDVEALLRSQTGINWTAYGHRQSDSVSRHFYLKKLQGLDEAHWRLHPVWNWSTQDVLHYLKARRVPVPSAGHQAGRRMRGFNVTRADSLCWVRDNYPRDWERVLRFFPAAEAICARFATVARNCSRPQAGPL